MADRPVNIRTIERYMLLAGDLPRPEIRDQPQGVNRKTRRPLPWWLRSPKNISMRLRG